MGEISMGTWRAKAVIMTGVSGLECGSGLEEEEEEEEEAEEEDEEEEKR